MRAAREKCSASVSRHNAPTLQALISSDRAHLAPKLAISIPQVSKNFLSAFARDFISFHGV